MCFIGLLLPMMRDKETRKHRRRTSWHRRSTPSDYSGHSEHSGHSRHSEHHKHSRRPYSRHSEHSKRAKHSRHYGDSERPQSRHSRRSDRSTHFERFEHSERPHRERSHQREKDKVRDSAMLAEEALARLCLSLEQSLLEEQQRWREQDRLDRAERYRLGLELDTTSFEAAPPYSPPRDASLLPRTTKTEPPAADSLRSRSKSSGDSTTTYYTKRCCRGCLCARCDSTFVIKTPAVPELDDTRVGAFAEGGADSRTPRAWVAGGPHAP